MPRVGKHRSDRRWLDDNGNEWASEWEHDVYHGLRRAGYSVRRCDERDTISYSAPVKQGRCVECSSQRVVQDRTYTADLYVAKTPKGVSHKGPYLVECKGFFARDRRNLFVSVAKELKSIGTSIRIVFQQEAKLKGTQQTNVSYIFRYCKNVVPGVWNRDTRTITWYETRADYEQQKG